jgi:serine protease
MKQATKIATVFVLVLGMHTGIESSFAADPIWDKIDVTRGFDNGDTPSYIAKQSYLEAAPAGVGAKDAWLLKGGRGENVKIVDVETCFETNHEDFNRPFYVGRNPFCTSNDHGTAVWGEVAARDDDKGMTGIAHGAQYGVYGFPEGELDEVTQEYIDGINTGIRLAAGNLQAGDVLIIEQHMNGPEHNNYTAVEYWKPIFDELKAATDKGIICVEAAGNGGSNFDAPEYQGAFDLKVRDSGCILVGAGDLRSHERLYFSNYGSRIDAQGFGGGVYSTGYGDLFNGSSTRKYTAQFSGTSSATPIVAGAIAVVSSIAKAQGRILTPLEVRAALRATGTAQGSITSDKRIGNLPNIKEILKFLGLSAR